MNIIKTDDFEKALKKLPKEIKQLYYIQEKRFISSHRDPRLHIKKINLLPGALSFRITRRYRVFFYFHGLDTAIFFDLDHRKDIYRN